MAKQFSALDPQQRAFLEAQKVFFVASATADSRVNVSPKGLDSLRVLGPNRVCWLDRTGSGSETAAHLMADGRLTLMTCAFEGPPLILRLYGRGRSLPRGTAEYAALLAEAFGPDEPPGSRQIIVLDFDLVQTSCGFAVPLFDFKAERPTLDRWAEAKGEDGLREYRRDKNSRSMDGLPTGLAD